MKKPRKAPEVKMKYTKNAISIGVIVLVIAAFLAIAPGACAGTNGYNWTAQWSGTTSQLEGISAVDYNNAWALGPYESSIYHFDGSYWSPEPSGTTSRLCDVDALDANHVWAVGGGPRSYTILLNDGSGWLTKESGQGTNLVSVCALSDRRVWAVGANGSIRYYNGSSWIVHPSVTDKQLNCVSALDANNVYAVGWDGTILHYDGTSWVRMASSITITEDLNSVVAVDRTHVWAVGEGGHIFFYDGTRWSEQWSGTSYTLWGVDAADARRVWAVGDGGTILFYDGITWRPQTSGTSASLFDINTPQRENLWAAGEGGTILFGEPAIPEIRYSSSGSAYTGTPVTIYGRNFGDTRGAGKVRFGSSTATDYPVWTDTRIQTYVPGGAVGNAPLYVITSGGVSNSVPFSVLPYILSVLPNCGYVGTTEVKLTGSAFGNAQGGSSVWFGSSRATTYTSWSNAEIKVRVGSGAYGRVSVKVLTGTGWSNAKAFDVRPRITSISPTSGPAGSTVTISGNAFGNTQRTSRVYFGSVAATSYSSWRNTEVRVAVPASISGTVQVKVYTDGGLSNGVNFTRR